MLKVGLITGGASGMGYAVAKALAAKGDWELNLLDMHAERGAEAAKDLDAVFHQVNVTDYSSLAGAFKAVFTRHRRLDFVFANAGIVERDNYHMVHDTGDEPPPEPSGIVVDVDLQSVITTSYLAQHYFRQSPNDNKGPRSLVITASCGGFYACPVQPIYGAAKHGVVGFTRNIAGRSWREDHVRVNAICPGSVKTNLMSAEAWTTFPEEYYTPVERVAEVVLMLLDGDGKQGNGDNQGKPYVGQTVELSGMSYYFRKQYDYCDDAMAATMGATYVDEYRK